MDVDKEEFRKHWKWGGYYNRKDKRLFVVNPDTNKFELNFGSFWAWLIAITHLGLAVTVTLHKMHIL